MQQSLFLLLMGQCYFLTCHLHEFHVIKEAKTWDEAQKFCRDEHTDLATVDDMQDNQRLSSSAGTVQEVWIGLKKDEQQNRRWHWSLPGLEYQEEKTNWAKGEPNDKGGPENCVLMGRNKKMYDSKCQTKKWFICYDDTKEGDERFKCMNKKMNWLEAQDYCREKHTDLLSGQDQLDAVKKDKFKGCGDINLNMWIGLFRDSWGWSDNSTSSFRNWDVKFEDEGGKKCAMIVIGENRKTGKWSAAGCDETKPFICYQDDASSSSGSDPTNQTKTEDEGNWSAAGCNETKPFSCNQEKMILIHENLTWTEALYYCRRHHKDLVSIKSQEDQCCVQEKAKEANTTFIWLGMRYTCTLDFWLWVSVEEVSYENWAEDRKKEQCNWSGAMKTRGEQSGKWFTQPDNEMFNFICSTYPNPT